MWVDVNMLSFIIDKTNFIIFKSPQHTSPKSFNIEFGRLSIKQTYHFKLPGFFLDENLSWKYHLIERSKKLARTSGMFFKVRQFLLIHVLICLYNSLLYRFFNMVFQFETHIHPDFLSQKKVLRVISFEHYATPSTPIFLDLKILNCKISLI